MGRYKKGHKLRNKDLWTDAGGREAIIKEGYGCFSNDK